MITRGIDLKEYVKLSKTLVLLGPRQVGKTTLIKHFFDNSESTKLFLNGDLSEHAAVLNSSSIEHFSNYLSGIELLVIDEAQNVKNVGQALKIINDEFKSLAVVATGSSAFELSGQVGEPLVGRKRTRYLYPFSFGEIANVDRRPTQLVADEQLEKILLYGLYPDVYLAQTNSERIELLHEIVDSLLLRDILKYQDVKGSDILMKLLSLLALQVGSEVSNNEIGTILGISKNTVDRYLDLLEKSFIIHKLRPLAANMRNSIKKKAKYYFYDNGIRNAIIRNFNPFSLRNDLGALWENFLVMERLKFRQYNNLKHGEYFWRNYNQQEVDLVEEYNGQYFAFEFKYGNKSKAKLPSDFARAFNTQELKTVRSTNFTSWLAS